MWNTTEQAISVYYNSGFGGDARSSAPGTVCNLLPGIAYEDASHGPV